LAIEQPGLRDRLMNLYLTLDAFPEVPDVLTRLKQAGLRTRSMSFDRSPSEPSPVLFVPFDIRPEHPLAPTEPACSSNSREETAAMPA
jgi:hypothetical protein